MREGSFFSLERKKKEAFFRARWARWGKQQSEKIPPPKKELVGTCGGPSQVSPPAEGSGGKKKNGFPGKETPVPPQPKKGMGGRRAPHKVPGCGFVESRGKRQRKKIPSFKGALGGGTTTFF